LNHPPKNGSQYFNRLTHVVNTATSLGMYVIIDYHNNQKGGEPTVYPGTSNPYYTEAVLHTCDPSCISPDYGDDIAWWKLLANTFKTNDHVLFDIDNEPKYGT